MPRKPAHEELERKVRNLEPGDHLCCIYEGREEHKAVLTPFLRQGLERGEKVFYIVDARTTGEVLSYLRQDGLKVEPYLESGQLAILTADQSYLREEVFDPDGMISLLKEETRRALAEGYSALRVTGEMTWALRKLAGSGRIIEYEAKLNDFFLGSKCLAICQYDRRRFGPEVLLEVLVTHPITVIGTEVFENFYYMATEDFLGPDPARARLDNWLGSLAERKRAEETLRESEKNYRQLLESLQEGVWCIDKDANTTFVNPPMAEMLGYTVNEMQGKHLFSFMDERAVEICKRNIERRKQGIREQHDFEFLRKDGTRVYTLVVTSPITDNDGNYAGAIAGVVDITERKRAEAQIIHAKQDWERTFDAVPDLIIILDKEYRVVRVNKAMADRLGCTPKDLVGQICYDAFHGTEKPAALCPHARLMADGLAHGAEVHEDRLGGDFLVSVNPLHDTDGKLTGSVHVARDITERKQMEVALRESEEKFRTIAETSIDAIYQLDKTGTVTFMNRAGAEMYGYKREEMEGTNYSSLVSKRRLPDAMKYVERVLSGENVQGELYVTHRKGHGFPIYFSMVPVIKENEIIGFTGISRDITERKRAEEALQKARDDLEQRVEERTAELVMANEQLRREIDERKQAEQALRQSEEHLRHLSSQLLEVQENERKRIGAELHDTIAQSLVAIKVSLERKLMEMDAAKRPLGISLEDLIALVQNNIEEVRRIIMELRPSMLDDLGILATFNWLCREYETVYPEMRIEKQLKVQEAEIPEPLKIVIFRVIQEALGNAAKHSKADLVKISLKRGGGKIALSVEDNGEGFDVDAVSSRSGVMKGLGISSMRERTGFSNGSFSIESAPGEGTVVRAFWAC